VYLWPSHYQDPAEYQQSSLHWCRVDDETESVKTQTWNHVATVYNPNNTHQPSTALTMPHMIYLMAGWLCSMQLVIIIIIIIISIFVKRHRQSYRGAITISFLVIQLFGIKLFLCISFIFIFFVLWFDMSIKEPLLNFIQHHRDRMFSATWPQIWNSLPPNFKTYFVSWVTEDIFIWIVWTFL